jgi:hypothetical protein
MRYATARRLSAAANLLAWLAVAVAEWRWGLAHRLLPVPAYSTLQVLQQVGAVLGLAVAVQAPFDLLGGYVLPRLYHFQPPRWWVFVFGWLRGVLVLGVLQGGLWLGLWALGQALGPWAVPAGVGLAGLLLLALQPLLARAVAPLTPARADVALAWLRLRLWNQPPPTHLQPVVAAEPAFSGGYVGLPGAAAHWVPEAWFRRLDPEVPAVQAVRRRLARKGWPLALALAWAWAVGGWAAAVGAGLLPTHFTFAHLLGAMLLLSPWWLLGAGLAAALNRRAVHGADAAALAAGLPLAELEAALHRLDRLQLHEPSRASWAHWLSPTPSVDRRSAYLNTPKPRPYVAAWGVWAATVWLSWAGCGLVGRAHARLQGRPELWAVPGED